MHITITDTMILLLLIALGPALFLIWFYLHQSRMDKKHRRLMIRTFIFGTLAIIPVYLINFLSKYFLDFDIQYFLNTSHLKGSLFFIFLGLACIGAIEEYSKALIVREVDWRKKEFSKITDGIEFSVATGLGFGFIENAIYFWSIYNMVGQIDNNLMLVIAFRSILSLLAHSAFSGIFGYYYGRAKVLHLKTTTRKKRHPIFHFHLVDALKIRYLRTKHFIFAENIHKISKEKFQEHELVAEGLLIAIILHVLYNFFITIGLTWISVILLAFELIFILHEFEVHYND